MNFIKAGRVESSSDGKMWRILGQGRPIFRQSYGAANLKISFPPTAAKWKFRKPMEISGAGAQQVELDLDVLAHAQPGLEDLRVMRGTNQVPYILQHTSISRSLALTVQAANNAKNPQLSRWLIKLPQADLPLARLACVSPTPLFERSLSLYEELADERGDKYQHPLGNATWTQTPDRKSKEFTLSLEAVPQSNTLFLETENGDNPPIGLEQFSAVYPVTRVLLRRKRATTFFFTTAIRAFHHRVTI